MKTFMTDKDFTELDVLEEIFHRVRGMSRGPCYITIEIRVEKVERSYRSCTTSSAGLKKACTRVHRAPSEARWMVEHMAL